MSHSLNNRFVVFLISATLATLAAYGAWTLLAGDSQTPRIKLRAALRPSWSSTRPMPTGSKTSLASADSDLGAHVVLPNTPLAGPGTAGTVWFDSLKSDSGSVDKEVDVTFPSSDIVVRYRRPVPYPNPADNYENYAKNSVDGNAHVITVGGTPALSILQKTDGFGNPGSVEFVQGGTVIMVVGWHTESELLSVAASIQARAAG